MIGDWFKTNFNFACFNDFNQQETIILTNLKFEFYVTVLRIMNEPDLRKNIVNYLCTFAEKKDIIRKKLKPC